MAYKAHRKEYERLKDYQNVLEQIYRSQFWGNRPLWWYAVEDVLSRYSPEVVVNRGGNQNG